MAYATSRTPSCIYRYSDVISTLSVPLKCRVDKHFKSRVTSNQGLCCRREVASDLQLSLMTKHNFTEAAVFTLFIFFLMMLISDEFPFPRRWLFNKCPFISFIRIILIDRAYYLKENLIG